MSKVSSQSNLNKLLLGNLNKLGESNLNKLGESNLNKLAESNVNKLGESIINKLGESNLNKLFQSNLIKNNHLSTMHVHELTPGSVNRLNAANPIGIANLLIWPQCYECESTLRAWANSVFSGNPSRNSLPRGNLIRRMCYLAPLSEQDQLTPQHWMIHTLSHLSSVQYVTWYLATLIFSSK